MLVSCLVFSFNGKSQRFDCAQVQGGDFLCMRLLRGKPVQIKPGVVAMEHTPIVRIVVSKFQVALPAHPLGTGKKARRQPYGPVRLPCFELGRRIQMHAHSRIRRTLLLTHHELPEPSRLRPVYAPRIIAPAKHAVDLLNTWPYLTRMYTTISPDEMMEDPIFRQNPNLDEVPALRQATRLVRCDGHATWTLPDGRVVFVPNNGAWPDFEVELPFEEEVQSTSIKGAPMTIVNNTAAIQKALDNWNRKMDPIEGQAPADSEADSDVDPSAGSDSDQGCGCDVQQGAGGALASLGVFGLLGLRAGRRRR